MFWGWYIFFQLFTPPCITCSLLQVLNPFYVFQIASIGLWMSDSYYYYAATIVIISLLSIGVSLYETKKVSMIVQWNIFKIYLLIWDYLRNDFSFFKHYANLCFMHFANQRFEKQSDRLFYNQIFKYNINNQCLVCLNMIIPRNLYCFHPPFLFFSNLLLCIIWWKHQRKKSQYSISNKVWLDIVQLYFPLSILNNTTLCEAAFDVVPDVVAR